MSEVLSLKFIQILTGKVVPFGIRFLSDTFEFDDGAAGKEAKNDAKGFKLSYKQESC